MIITAKASTVRAAARRAGQLRNVLLAALASAVIAGFWLLAMSGGGGR